MYEGRSLFPLYCGGSSRTYPVVRSTQQLLTVDTQDLPFPPGRRILRHEYLARSFPLVADYASPAGVFLRF